MKEPTYDLAPETNVPDHFLHAIGLVMVTHAHMDTQLQQAIGLLSGMGYNSVVSVLAPVTSTATRAQILQNLARTTSPDMNTLCKLLVVGDVIKDVSSERNVIAHGVPYFYSPSKDEIGYFKEINKTVPQIKQQPPYITSIEKLFALANQIRRTASCLFGLNKFVLPNDGVDLSAMTPDERASYIRANATRSPVWSDTGQFPWPDKLTSKLSAESRNPVNTHRAKKNQ